MIAKEFLIHHRQSADNIDVSVSLVSFWTKMQQGLNGRGGMPMIPTYLMNVDRSKIRSGEKHILIDAGGTNFRSALGYFDEQGNVVIEKQSKTVMPASDRLLSKSQFYNAIASNIKSLLPDGKNIGFCFSYQVDMGEDLDGKVVMFSKEIQAPEVIGTQVGQETLAACMQYDSTKRKIVILNDTVATLLGGMATNSEQFSAYLGYIYGTGTNVCYIEDTAKIGKVKYLPEGKMLVNTECGNFDGFEIGDFDKVVIGRTAVPDKQLFEKMTSGKYLSDIMYEALRVAVCDGVLSDKTQLERFQLRDLTALFEDGDFVCKFNKKDRQRAIEICKELIRRAAKMGAIVNSALAIATCKDKSLPVAIVAEGTTFNKLPFYREFFEQYLTEILGAEGIRYKILQGEDLNLIGTLMSTMLL